MIDMADITMCRDEECTLKETCYRFKAVVNEYRQSYFSEPVKNEKDEDGNHTCNHYWEVDKLPSRKIPLRF